MIKIIRFTQETSSNQNFFAVIISLLYILCVSRRLSQISHLFARKKRPQRFQRFRSRKNFMTAQPEHFPSAVLGQVDPRRRDSLDPTLLLVDPRRRDSLDPTLLLVDPRRRDSLDPTLLLADMEFLENYNIVQFHFDQNLKRGCSIVIQGILTISVSDTMQDIEKKTLKKEISDLSYDFKKSNEHETQHF